MNLKDLSFTKDWTLFLDRDGVINRRIPDDYVTRWEDFHFLERVLEAMADLAGIFGRIVIVSNQQGVGKGLMSEEELALIDREMKKTIRQHEGRIDASYYSTYMASENHPDRKPGTGMGHKAKGEFPEIDFSRSVMVGDSITDMEFGKKLGMVTVFIAPDVITNEMADFRFKTLLEFSKRLQTSDQ